jgi:hypothetical protein
MLRGSCGVVDAMRTHRQWAPQSLPSSSSCRKSRPLGFSLLVLGIELRTLHLLGRHCTTSGTLPALFVLVIFEIGSQFMPWFAWTMIFLFVCPQVAGKDNAPPCLAIG